MSKISVTKTREYVENWNDHWQNYLALNIDLKEAGINCKRTSKNHYVKHGINENRQVERQVILDSVVLAPQPIDSPVITRHSVQTSNGTYNFIIQKSMFTETI